MSVILARHVTLRCRRSGSRLAWMPQNTPLLSTAIQFPSINDPYDNERRQQYQQRFNKSTMTTQNDRVVVTAIETDDRNNRNDNNNFDGRNIASTSMDSTVPSSLSNIWNNLIEKFSLSKEAAIQSPTLDTKQRWWAIPAANLVHLSIGGVYVYSMWTPGMTQTLGVVSSAATDWTVAQVLPVFSTAAVTLGVTTFCFGSWVEKVGPRLAGVVGSIFWSSGLITTGLGVHLHSLPLLYLGYGVLGGVGWGFMYLSPVTTVMKWFPDKRGLATGIALSAFGAGAALGPGLIHFATDLYAVAPDYIGPITSSPITTGITGNEIIAPTGNETTAMIENSNNNSSTSLPVVTLSTLSDGSQVVASNSLLGVPGQPVVIATDMDLSKTSLTACTEPGAYALGTGKTGVAEALGTLGVLYGAMGIMGSRYMTVPHPDWVPKVSKKDNENFENQQEQKEIGAIMPVPKTTTTTTTTLSNNEGLSASYATWSTSQFPLLWISIFGNATGGLALLSSSKLMLTDIWSSLAPGIVTSSFATGYVATLGLGMTVGRFGWSFMSDYLGRKQTYALFGLGIPIVGMSPLLTHSAAAATVASGSEMVDTAILPYLFSFYGGSVLAITFYGGIFSILPAYIADLFGPKHAGAIHGKLLTAWAASAVAGPMGLAYLRGNSESQAIQELLTTIQNNNKNNNVVTSSNNNGGMDNSTMEINDDIDAFQQAFGCNITDLESVQTLIDAKTITIPRLLELVPNGTIDPTLFLYDTTCYTAAGLMGISFIANMAIQPCDYKQEQQQEQEQQS